MSKYSVKKSIFISGLIIALIILTSIGIQENAKQSNIAGVCLLIFKNNDGATSGNTNARKYAGSILSSIKSPQEYGHVMSSKNENSDQVSSKFGEDKKNFFQYILCKNCTKADELISEDKRLDMILLGQINRDVLESSYGQRIKESHSMDVIVLGKINISCPYAVFSTTLQNRESQSFVFLLPLTILAWKRVGFESVVIIVGWRDEWNSDPLYSDVITTCYKLGAVLIFLESKQENIVMISQVSRLFAANILKKKFQDQPGINDVYLLTTDSDIWPINGSIYQLPDSFNILTLNSDCCPPFTHRNVKYRMFPMTNIGARIRTWGKLTETNGTKPANTIDILSMFHQEFGSVAVQPVVKGENVGWYLDQQMISIRIDKYVRHNINEVKYVPRHTRNDRIDRSNWSVKSGIKGKVDSHLLLNTFTPSVWPRVVELLKLLYGEKSAEFDFCNNYYTQFQDRFTAKYYELSHAKNPKRMEKKQKKDVSYPTDKNGTKINS